MAQRESQLSQRSERLRVHEIAQLAAEGAAWFEDQAVEEAP